MMLKFFLLGLLGYVILCSIIQAFVTLRFILVLRTPVVASNEFAFPRAAIILVIRGPDPSLEENIRALLAQIYPDYKLFVVIDHIEDPAWPIVAKIRNEIPDRIQVSVLKEPLNTCSLKCSAMAQAIGDLDPSYEVVAFADGDVLVHQTWLRELVEPLSDPKIGVSTGNRWYLPSDSSLGSMTRYFWNVGVVMQLWLNEFVWPGSMAIRSDALDKMGMVAALRTSLFDGPAVVRQVRSAEYNVRFVPSVMITNREQISLRDFTSWIERQTVVAGSAERHNWLLLAFNALHVAVCVFAPPLVAITAFGLSDSTILSWALLSVTCYWLVMSFSVLALERAVRGILSSHQTEFRWFSWQKAFSAAPSILLAHLVPLVAFIRAFSRKTVTWRGIEYELRGPNDVQMLHYRPYGKTVNPSESVL
jgi:cellulose synthase/poly-beta-1,6-N-acetylglucosamine synthase-like glycosyltransferase